MTQSYPFFAAARAMLFVMAAAGFSHRAQADSKPDAASAPSGPVRVLMLAGGIAHDYDALPKKLADNLNRQDDLRVRVTSDLSELNKETLADVDVIVFNTCVKEGLGEPQRQAIVDALRRGTGIVGLHCALWCWQDWPAWREIMGGLVLKHGKFGPYDVSIVDRHHPIAAGLPETFTVTDEAYYVDERRPGIHVIAQTAKVHPGRQDRDPQAWTTRYAGGRVFVLSQGHDDQVQSDPAFLKLLANGIRWAGRRLGPPTMLSELEREQGFVPLFDGRTLKGWRYDPRYWKVKDGIIIGDSRPAGLKKNSFAITERSYGDFILRFSVRWISGNSGVQFRSRARDDLTVAGYQSDVVLPFGWGNLHEQDGRARLVDGWTGKADRAVSGTDWNDLEIEARGPHIILRTNGVVTADWTEPDPTVPREGIIALQMHRGEPMEVQFTNIRIKPLGAKKQGAGSARGK